ncbi:MAG: beta-galactosidase, partial [Candidatus Thorarchaeota archaeon]
FEYLMADAAMQPWVLTYPDVVGYWTDNEMDYGPVYRYIYGEGCGNAFIEWLQGNLTRLAPGAELPPNQVYGDISELNSAWSSTHHTYSYTNWAEIISGSDPVEIRGWDDTAVMEDMYAFEREIYRAYCYHVITALRTAEDTHSTPHKLIISNRFAYAGPCYYTSCLKRVMDLFSDFDIIGLNLYPAYNRMRTHFVFDYLEDLEATFVNTTGRPFIVAEYGLAAVDSGIDIARWRPMTANTQEQRGIGYRNLVNQLFHLPYCIGAHWYRWENEYYSDGYYDPRNCGVVDDHDNYYTNLTDYMVTTNTFVGSYGRTGLFSIRDFYWDSLYVTIADGT